jgi:hypothetical protein
MRDISSQKEQEILPILQRWHHPIVMSPNPLPNKRILLVSPSPPFPQDNGAKQRTHLLWKALSEIAPVDVILCEDISFDSSVTANWLAVASIPTPS